MAMTEKEMERIRRHPIYIAGWESHDKWYQNGKKWPRGVDAWTGKPPINSEDDRKIWSYATWSATRQNWQGWPAGLPPIYDNPDPQLSLFD